MAPSVQETRDHLGRAVRVGSRVRVLALPEILFESVDADELTQVREMIGALFEVEEIDAAGLAWVTKWWDLETSDPSGHGIGLSPSEMELVLGDVVEGSSVHEGR
jgi:hypothetical protein